MERVDIKDAARKVALAGGRMSIEPDGITVTLRRDGGVSVVEVSRRIVWAQLESASFDIVQYVVDELGDRFDAATGRKGMLS